MSVIGRFRNSTAIATVTAFGLLALSGGEARAACDNSNGPDGGTLTTCTGSNPYPYIGDVQSDTKGRYFVFKNLGQDISQNSEVRTVNIYTSGNNGKDAGENGTSGRSLSLDVAAAPYTFSSDLYGTFAVQTYGGNGNDGTNRGDKGATENKSGGDGGAGGAGGEAFVTWRSGNIADRNSNLVQSKGGAGSQGGAGVSGTETGSGGNGGVGGAGGYAHLDMATEAPVDIKTSSLWVRSFGGAGGQGGRGSSLSGRADGTKGGFGGAGGLAEIKFYDNTSVSQQGAGSRGLIRVESIGGPGGKGGNASGGTGNSSAGNGEQGGTGGKALVQTLNGAQLTVTSDFNGVAAIEALSLGGAGGSGGNGTTDIGAKAKGGDGGAGGFAGIAQVDIVTSAQGITVNGDKAQGIFVRSYGGAGGDGGDGAGGLGKGKGGGGGGGGNAYIANVFLTGNVTVTGNESNGILAQSVGGFAGNAGDATGFLAYGAGSESGGLGSAVNVIINAGSKITTQGAFSAGVVAQSVGGGGGRGSSADGLVSLGGDGSAGGNGGVAYVTADGALISTKGSNSTAIQAQSVGGGGGSAPGTSGLVSLGGKGGSGGNGGEVRVGLQSTLTTNGAASHGVQAQSIGGGGGDARTTRGAFAFGNSGGAGGDGGSVTVEHQGANGVTTNAADSYAVFLQSVGGGGGSGSSAVSGSAFASMSMGGSGSTGGDGGTVAYSDLTQAAYALTTKGDRSGAIVAESIGGGGGNGGFGISASAGIGISYSMGASGAGGEGGNGGGVTVDTVADFATSGMEANGIHAESIGGGGGNSGTSIASSNTGSGLAFSMALGASAGAGGDGGAVSVTSSGSGTTGGDDSAAIFAGSVGGGGGNSGLTISGNVYSDVSIGLALGGNGGAGGNAGNVTVVANGPLTTAGMNSQGVAAESTGGGGGSAKIAAAASAFSQGSLSLALGGNGGSGGNGGTVNVTTAGAIATQGENADGIHAESTGGGGGSGALTIAGSLSSSFATNIGLGGSGGGSGDGGDVTVLANGSVQTSGLNAVGIFAQSVSRGGGDARLAITGSGISGGNVGLSLSGNGGAGGSSGDVTVTANDSVSTSGDWGVGIKAASLAGGGGSATGAVNGSLFAMGQVGVSLGGGGGKGGNAGDVSVTTGGSISTAGVYADAIYGASTGGSGGNGGFVAQGSMTGGEYSGSLNVNIGGSGGNGGKAGSVTVNTAAFKTIATTGYQSRGIYAGSTGGSGGNGGSVYSGNIVISSSGGVAVGTNLGGNGGDGASVGGDVQVVNASNLVTSGDYSDGIFAESVGGPGGNGGSVYAVTAQFSQSNSASILTNIGGTGGSGGDGGYVKVSNTGNIDAVGALARGIFAQSVGGGGGRGGNSASILFNATTQGQQNTSKNVTINVATNVGGDGGVGGHGADVDVVNGGQITSSSFGIFAQSVGGGGGDGGSVSSLVFSVSGDGCTYKNMFFDELSCTDAKNNKSSYAPTLQLLIGGGGGAAGNGGNVSVANSGAIATTEDSASAIFAQSVGGGGGTGGYGTLGADIIAPNQTAQAYIDEAVLLSKPIKNTKKWQTANIIIGGNGGAAGDGGDIDVQNLKALQTSGFNSFGIFAQSIGGGGGNGGDASSGFGKITTFNLGGAGDGGGHGGAVKIVNSGAISTTGDASIGIFGQSIGGGGGTAGVIAQAFNVDVGSVQFSMGITPSWQQNGGKGGDGGDVSITIEAGGGITTSGHGAHGIVAQSVGGSGGIAEISGMLDLSPLVLSGSNGGQGKGGNVTVETNAPILLTGDQSTAVIAQSVSGGLSTQVATSDAGAVDVTINSDIRATGILDRGLMLQSQGKDKSGNVTLTIAQGVTVTTGATARETVLILDGIDNTITNNGSLLSVDDGLSTSNWVISTMFGGNSIVNNGLIEGSISMGTENRTFLTPFAITNNIVNNGTMGLGRIIDLGKNTIFENDGLISAGTAGTIGSTAFTGTLNQSDTGRIQVDFDIAGNTDLIAIGNGNAASMAGKVLPNILGAVPSTGDSGQVLFLTSDVGLDSTALTVGSSATVTYTLGQSTVGSQEQLSLDWAVDYTPTVTPGPNTGELDQDETAVGKYFSKLAHFIDESSSDALKSLFKEILTTPDLASLADLYDGFRPEGYLKVAEAASLSSLRFDEQLHSCPARDTSGAAAFVAEGSCIWGAVTHSHRKGDEYAREIGFTENAPGLSLGAQVEVGPGLFAGFAAGFEDFSLNTERSNSDGDRYQLGASLKYQAGPTTLSATLSGGVGKTDLTRTLSLPLGPSTLSGSTTTKWFAGHLRARHWIELDSGTYIEPWFDAGATHVREGSVSESGAQGLGLKIDSNSHTLWTLNPGVKIATNTAIGKTGIELSAKASLLSILNNHFYADVSLIGAPDQSFTYVSTSSLDRHRANLGLAVKADLPSRIALAATLDGQFSSHEHGFSVGGRLYYSF